jgi:hypothetical protein
MNQPKSSVFAIQGTNLEILLHHFSPCHFILLIMSNRVARTERNVRKSKSAPPAVSVCAVQRASNWMPRGSRRRQERSKENVKNIRLLIVTTSPLLIRVKIPYMDNDIDTIRTDVMK